jgi:hypothetical protein
MNSLSFSLSVELGSSIVRHVGSCRRSFSESLIFAVPLFCYSFVTDFGNCRIPQTLTVSHTFFKPLLSDLHLLNSFGKQPQRLLCSALQFFFMSVFLSARSYLFSKN